MKKKIIKVLLSAFACSVILAGGFLPMGAVEPPRTLLERIPAGKAAEIILEASDMLSIEVNSAGERIGAEESYAGGAAGVSAKLEKSGGKTVIRLEGPESSHAISGDSRGKALAGHVKVFLPAGRRLIIRGRSLSLSGDINAESLLVEAASVFMHALKIHASDKVSVKAGTGQLKFSLTGAKKLSVEVEHASGRIIMPAVTEFAGKERESLVIERTGRPSVK
ncbi:MAG TPA: hypothetical protein PKK31_02185 [Elusimicrobiales bacterium]|nr:hypothetical protein [Elusimicrobiales bacterium]